MESPTWVSSHDASGARSSHGSSSSRTSRDSSPHADPSNGQAVPFQVANRGTERPLGALEMCNTFSSVNHQAQCPCCIQFCNVF